MALYLPSRRMLAVALGVNCLAYSGQSEAATIVAPVAAFATSEFISTQKPPNDYSIENTIDQSGLSLGYESGVTDFDSYLASNPTHTSAANGTEWFSQDYQSVSQTQKGRKASKKKGSKAHKKNSKIEKKNPVVASIISGLSVTYRFSALTSINSFVLWNEEFAGIGTTQLLSSVDGITYTLLGIIKPVPSTFAPSNTIIPYAAQTFSFELTSMLFFRLLIADCPGPPPSQSSYRGCGIGEVAFSAVPPGPVNSPPIPLPAALPLLASALGLFAWLGRRRTNFN